MAASSKSAFTKVRGFFYERMRHKDAWSMADAEPTTGFASLSCHKYALLISYRRDGEGVPSPVWFGRDEQDRVYFVSEEASGKAKRIRHNPEVRLAPCDVRGKPLGPPGWESHGSSIRANRSTQNALLPPTTASDAGFTRAWR